MTGAETREVIGRGLLMRALGPSADDVAEGLRRYTEYELRTVRRIVECAAARSGALDDGARVNPRVADVVLGEGSHREDEILANYLGGLLAGCRILQGEDDRAVAWSKVVSSLSVLELRAHYLLYREWAARLRIIGVYELGIEAGRTEATMGISSTEFARLLTGDCEVAENDATSDAIEGLIRVGLLDNNVLHNGRVLRVTPSITGLELYGWAQGVPGLAPRSFAAQAQLFDTADAIPRPRHVSFPQLPPHKEATVHAASRQIQVQHQVRLAKQRGTSRHGPR